MNNRKIPYNVFSKQELNSFEKLFRLYYPRLKNYASSILRDPDEAEDLVQDVFYQVWLNHMKLDEEKNIGSYLFTLLKNRCLNVLRHRVIEEKYSIQKNKDFAEELYHVSFMEAEEFVSLEERLISELETVISGMPEKCQIAFRLKWFERKKIREIAEIMDISTTMVDKHLAKGIQIVREKLNPDLFIFFIMMYKQD